MLGGCERYEDVSFFWSRHYDVPINYVGHAESWDELTIEGDWVSEPDPGYVHETSSVATASVDERNPAHAWMRGHQTDRYRWPGQTIELQSRGQITSTEDAFNVTLQVAITIDDVPHCERQWMASFPRRLM